MKTVKRTMYFPKFSEKCNDFCYEERTFERPVTEQERNLKRRYGLLFALMIVYLIALPIGLILALATEANLWDLILIPIVFAWSWLFAKMLNTLFKWEDKIDSFNDYGFDAEVLQWEQITQEENDKAAKWRAEHEFEELIRKAKLSANCVDIAKAAKYYAKHYIKGDD